MIRLIRTAAPPLLAVSLMWSASSVLAQATRPAAPGAPAAAAAAARKPALKADTPAPLRLEWPELTHLHEQAYALMREGDFQSAFEPLEKVYSSVAAEKRTRALVLNHAILDITQGRYIMRGLRDLLTYLSKHRDEDEPATNILAIGLNNSANSDVKLKKSDLWQAAYREWDRRNYELDHSRKGWHRWGTRWLNEQEFVALETKRNYIAEQIRLCGNRIDRLMLQFESFAQQAANYNTAAGNYEWLRQNLQVVNDPSNRIWGMGTFLDEEGSRMMQGVYDSMMEVVKINGEANTVTVEIQHENKRLEELLKQDPKPEWPTRVDPIDPKAPWPPTLYNDGMPKAGAGGGPASRPSPLAAGAAEPATTAPATQVADDPSQVRPMIPPVPPPPPRKAPPGRLYPQGGGS